MFSNDPNYPVKVYSANHFDKNRQIETEIPVIVAHDSVNPHYESLLPKGKTDIPKCIELVKAIQNNTYDKFNAKEFWNLAQKAKKREADRQRFANMPDEAKKARQEQNTAHKADARSKEAKYSSQS